MIHGIGSRIAVDGISSFFSFFPFPLFLVPSFLSLPPSLELSSKGNENLKHSDSRLENVTTPIRRLAI